MGQRANYIIKEGDQLTIHYHHWRANHISSDIYLGEKKFLEFVRDCQLKEEIIPEPWIEGCVIIDLPQRQLHFYELHFPTETSVIDFYLSKLAEQWPGWQVHMMRNRMYDAEKVLQIDYSSQQELPELYLQSEEFVVNDKVGEWDDTVVFIKVEDEKDLFITKTGNLTIESIIRYGATIIPLLKDKQPYPMPGEEESVTSSCIIIDTFRKKLFINESPFGLWEQTASLWEGYKLIMGDVGYLGILQLAGIDTANLAMPHQKVVEYVEHMAKQKASFDPLAMAEKLSKESDDIQFNPDFFDTVQPKKGLLESMKLKLSKLFKK